MLSFSNKNSQFLNKKSYLNWWSYFGNGNSTFILFSIRSFHFWNKKIFSIWALVVKINHSELKKVYLSDECLKSGTESCRAVVQMRIFRPESEDDGRYSVRLKFRDGEKKLGTISRQVDVKVSNERTNFVININTTDPTALEYNKFTIGNMKNLT